MLDLLAAISSVDPPSFVAWLVLAFAAGMYPVGIMLGSSCSKCCCGCPDMCGYYIESRAGAYTAYPTKPDSTDRVEENEDFCSLSQYLDYDTDPADKAEVENTPGLPSKCGFDAQNVQYTAKTVTTENSIWARVTAKLGVTPQDQSAAPAAQARVDLTCNNGTWNVETEFSVARSVGGQIIQCSATKTFSITPECSLDSQGCQPTPRQGANIDGLVIIVSGTAVSLPTLGRTILYTPEDRDDDCMTDACLEAWRSLWQARFQLFRVPCAPPKCALCTEGELPETMTVTFDGLADQAPGPDLCLLTFSAPYGSGAAGKVTSPGGDPDTEKGPISAASVTNGGSGYAKLGRVAPTITASGGSGSGATFSVSTTSANDANGIPSWSVTGVTWTGTTSGYADGDQITFDVASGDTVEQGAAATIRTVRTAPTVTASASGGSGATFGVTIAPNGTTPQTWSVTGITVTNGGTGYPASGYLTFNVASGDTQEQSADVVFYSGRLVPTVTASVNGSGTGASLSASLASATGWNGQTYWYVDGISITSGGSGYAEFDPVNVTVTDGEGYGAYAEVTSVDGSGAITGVAVYWGGEYFKSNGIIQSVEFGWGGGGTYYRDAGEISSISVEAGGKYHREDASLPPYVATVTVGVWQAAPSDGTGATLTATVEDDTGSADFGKITGVTVDDGGDGYLAWQWRNTKCCGDYYNGLSVVLKRMAFSSWNACEYGHSLCGVGNISGRPGRIYLTYNGPATPPTLAILSEYYPGEGLGHSSSACNTFFEATTSVADCSDWSDVSFSASGGRTATVSAGGEYDPLFRNPGGNGGASCNVCCKGDEAPPQEITVSVTGAGNGSVFDIWPDDSPLGDYDGDFVLSRGVGLNWSFDPPPVPVPGSLAQWDKPPLSVSIESCSSQDHTGFSEDGYGCDFCHKKCRILFNYVGFEQRFCKGADPNHCGVCVDTPMCSPVGASFTLCKLRPQTTTLGSLFQLVFCGKEIPPMAGTIVERNDCTDYGDPPEWARVLYLSLENRCQPVEPPQYAWPERLDLCTMQVTIS